MTGFASGKKSSNFGEISIEIQSLNRKFLDLHFSLPPSMSHWEISLRNLIQEVIDRGVLKITINLSRTNQNPVAITVNLALVGGYLEAWKQLQNQFCVKGEIDFSFLALQKDIFQVEDRLEEPFFSDVEILLKEVLNELQAARALEGQKIAKDLQLRIEMLKKNTAKIRKMTENSAKERLELLKQRINKLIGQCLEEEKMIRQLAVLADSADVTEEIVRLESHLEYLIAWLFEPLSYRQTKGKQLEFFVQELSREVNTLGAKIADSDLSLLVIEMKSEIEKIKEQSQNIE